MADRVSCPQCGGVVEDVTPVMADEFGDSPNVPWCERCVLDWTAAYDDERREGPQASGQSA